MKEPGHRRWLQEVRDHNLPHEPRRGGVILIGPGRRAEIVREHDLRVQGRAVDGPVLTVQP